LWIGFSLSASAAAFRAAETGKIFSNEIRICKIFRDVRAFNYAILRAPLCSTLPEREREREKAPLYRVACKYTRATLFDGSSLSISNPRDCAQSRDPSDFA